MTSQRSMFTEAIEDHLALKKQNAVLEATMPLTRFEVGDPLDRYPGGPVKPAVDEVPAASALADDDEASAFRPEPIGGMVTTLSLVEDVEEPGDDADTGEIPVTIAQDIETQVLRFPGGVGTGRDDEAALEPSTGATATAVAEDEAVIMIDPGESLSGMQDRPSLVSDVRRKKPSFFGIRRKRKDSSDANGSGWFANEPRDFDWGSDN